MKELLHGMQRLTTRLLLGLLIVLLAGAAPAACPPGDLTGDCRVDFEDLSGLADGWLVEDATPADLDGNGEVTLTDYGLLAAHWRSAAVPLTINEVMASNASAFADPHGQFDDWIEIYNAADDPLNVAGMYLTDDPAEPTKWRFRVEGRGATTIGPKGYLLVWADAEPEQVGLHAGFALDAEGDEVHLFDADGQTLIDSLVLGPQTPDVSYGRYPDAGRTERFFAVPTPGQANNEGYLGEVAPLHFSRRRGFYNAPFDLTISTATEDAEILYTTDGRAPDDTRGRFPAGKPYTGPLRISATTCLRVMARKPGWKPTAIHTHTYIFDSRESIRSLPVVSLVGDPGQTFYEPDGVMAIVGGSYGGSGWVSGGPGTYNNPMQRGLERPVSAEWIEPGGNRGFQVDCGLRVHGSNYMRPRYRRQDGVWSGSGKFSFRLYFRGQYGTSWLDYPLFAESDVDRFKSIVLRGGHNDRTNPFIKDELIRRLHKDMGQRACMGNFANLFINGDYKGYFNPTEHVKEESCRLWFDSDEPWDVMTMNGIRDGDTRSWNEMMNDAQSHSLADPAHYAELSTKLDIVSFVDYLIVRLWGGDWDWPQNNWSAAAERSAQGRWKFFVWDAEGSMFSNRLDQVRFGELNSQGNPNGRLYRALKASPQFRLLFADRIYKHFYNGGALGETNVQRWFLQMRDVMHAVIPNMNMYVLDGWVPNRLDIFLEACRAEGMYTFDGPTFIVDGAPQHGGTVASGQSLSMVSPQSRGTVYYTTDGTDPSGLASAEPPEVTTLVTPDASKWVLVPTDPRAGVGRTGDWLDPQPFDDSYWIASTGAPGGVGYENNSGYETYISTDVGAAMSGARGSCYIRIPFDFSGDPASFSTLSLRVQYDDGFVAYLNGQEVARRNFAGDPAWDSLATSSHSDSAATGFESIDVTSSIGLLRPGENLLAIHGLNVSLTSSDFLINAELSAAGAPPDAGPPEGIVHTDPLTLTRSTRVKARVRSGSTWSALSEATFAVGPVAESLRISELMYHPAEPNTEYVELTNTGPETIDLSLVKFTDGITFEFPPVSLRPGAYCLIVESVAAFEARYGPGLPVVGQYEGSLSNGGERLALQDAAGTTIHAFRFRDDWHELTDGFGFSLIVLDPAGSAPGDWGNAAAWRPSAAVGGSPGRDDSDQVPQFGRVVVNELLANSQGGVPDWIELFNDGDEPVDLGGWFLSDDADDPRKYEVPLATTIPPGGFLVLTEDRHFGDPDAPGCHMAFALSKDGERVYLYSGAAGALTGYSDRVNFGPSEPGVTFGRHPVSTGDDRFVPLDAPTPGAANAYPRIGPVVITEIMYHPDFEDVANAEYVELRNVSDRPVTLYDEDRAAPWRFTDDPDDPGIEYLFPAAPPVTIEPGQYIVLVGDRVLFHARYGAVGPVEAYEWGPGRLDNAGDTLQLSRPADLDDEGNRLWIAVDRVSYSDGAHPEGFRGGVDPWPVSADGLGSALARVVTTRYGDDPNNWRAETPSPGRARYLAGR